MTTYDTIIDDLNTHVLTSEFTESLEFKCMVQFEPEKVDALKDSQTSFTCCDEKTSAFRHYEIMYPGEDYILSDGNKLYFDAFAMCLYNDGTEFLMYFLGYGEGTWQTCLTYSLDWQCYNMALDIQTQLANRTYEWIEKIQTQIASDTSTNKSKKTKTKKSKK